MSLTDFGINNSLTTKVFTTKNTKEISSVLLFNFFSDFDSDNIGFDLEKFR